MNNDNKEVQNELQDLIRQKEASIQAKGRLIDNMAYQIRTLSNAVIGFSDLLLTEQLSDELTEYVKEINQAGNGLSALVNEVLDWARIESGRLSVSHTQCPLSPIIRSLERMVSTSAGERGLDYHIEVDPDLPARILTDEDRLLKCLINLTANTFKYTHEGTISLRILAIEHDGTPSVRFDMNSSGIGMTDEQIAQLFEPALRAEDANNEVLTMLDMGFTVTAGLPLTKQLIELLGGSLTVTSQPEDGSTFSLVLPTGLDADAVGKLGAYTTTVSTEPEPEPAETEPVVPKILLVEDQQSNRMVISLMLEALGVSVETAEDGQVGVQMASQGRYDLILMDLKMPRMDGYQACQTIRENHISVPIVALSAKVLNEQENRQINTAFDGFLTKPVDSRKLSETLRQFVAGRDNGTASARDAADEEVITFEYGN